MKDAGFHVLCSYIRSSFSSPIKMLWQCTPLDLDISRNPCPLVVYTRKLSLTMTMWLSARSYLPISWLNPYLIGTASLRVPLAAWRWQLQPSRHASAPHQHHPSWEFNAAPYPLAGSNSWPVISAWSIGLYHPDPDLTERYGGIRKNFGKCFCGGVRG